jgi:hypothetical protein
MLRLLRLLLRLSRHVVVWRDARQSRLVLLMASVVGGRAASGSSQQQHLIQLCTSLL